MRNTTQMSRSNLEAYRARWQRVNEFQNKESREMPISLKLRQANMLFRLAQNTQRSSEDDPEVTIVRARWVTLKELYEKSNGTGKIANDKTETS